MSRPKQMRPSYAAAGAALLCAGILTGWAAVAEVEVAVRAEGQVVPSGSNRRAQHLEGGVVRELLVREGDRVGAGQVVAVIVPEAAEAEAGERRARIEALEAQAARLLAEATGGIPEWPAPTSRRAAEAVAREAATLRANRESLERRMESLEEGAARAEAEARAKRARAEGLRVQEEAVRRSFDMHRRALREGAGMAGRVAEVEAQLAAVRSEMAFLPEAAAADDRTAAEARARARAEAAQFRAEAARQLGLVKAEAEGLMENVRASEDRRRRADVRSPVEGTVQRLHVFAPGEVVPPHSTVAEVVPAEDGLLFEARVPPDRIRGLRPGLPALVRLTAMDVSRYGSLEGEVVSVSPDAQRDERTGASFYRARIRTARDSLGGEPLRAGMQGEASIVTGERTVLGYFMGPLARWSHVALTER